MSVTCQRCHKSFTAHRFASYERLCWPCHQKHGQPHFETATREVPVEELIHRVRCLCPRLLHAFHLSECGGCGLPGWGYPCWACGYYQQSAYGPRQPMRTGDLLSRDDFVKKVSRSASFALCVLADLSKRAFDVSYLTDLAMAKAGRLLWPDAGQIHDAFGRGPKRQPAMPPVIRRYWTIRLSRLDMTASLERNPHLAGWYASNEQQSLNRHADWLELVGHGDLAGKIRTAFASDAGEDWAACEGWIDRNVDFTCVSHVMLTTATSCDWSQEERHEAALAYADWLEDDGRYVEANKIRGTITGAGDAFALLR